MRSLAASRSAIDSHQLVRQWFSPATLGLTKLAEKVVGATVEGRVLDVGCGTMPYRPVVEATGAEHIGLDLEARADGVRYLCSATEMTPVATNSHDSAICSEVLEHIADPAGALAEMSRVVRPGGRLVLTVPFLGRLHEEPHDYFRYTEHGLRSLLNEAGFRIDDIHITGSVGSLLGHQVSSALVVPAWNVPALRWIVFAANAALVVAPARLVDRLLGPVRRKLPLGYVVTATNT